ncbi:MAG: glycoside hydrolase family 2 TIM barrel-domain containing protein [Saccharofermentanales bacterium]
MIRYRQIIDLNQDWRFARTARSGHDEPVAERSFCKVDLPHDYALEGGYETNGDGSQGFIDRWHDAVYQKTVDIPVTADRRYFLQFDGVMRNSEIYVNGLFVGGRPYGYVPFCFEISDRLRNGENSIEVRVENGQPPADRWYSGAGIYRDVQLVITANEHFRMYGIYITTETEPGRAWVNLSMDVSEGHHVATTILSPIGTVIASAESGIDSPTVRQRLDIADPLLWSPETPVLYTAYCVIYNDHGIPVDDSTTTFGIRTIVFDNSRGLLVNGKLLKLKGVNLHHDGGCVGAAVPAAVWTRRLDALKEIGCNAIRCSHNPPAADFLDLCDRIGFLVIDEAFDKWTWTKGYYYKIFDQWWKADLEAMILRDRNHPCVFLWSVGNEVENQGTPGMLDLLGMLAAHTRSIDPTRPVTYAMEPHCNIAPDLEACAAVPLAEKVALTKKIADLVDVLCCNYQEQWYPAYREAIPDKLIIGSETYAYFRGDGNEFLAHKEMSPWFDVRDNDFVIGQFIWPGIDYLGEAVNRSVRGKTGGLIDMAGFIKPAGYFYQSLWTEQPMVYACVTDSSRNYYWSRSMQGHWSWPNVTEGWNFPWAKDSCVELCIYTNCEAVEITVNGGRRTMLKKSDYPNGIIRHYKAYSEGLCEVSGIIGGVRRCTHKLVTGSDPERLELACTQNDGEFAVVECCVKDDRGNTVTHQESSVEFGVSGTGRLVGTDSGDMSDFTEFSSVRRTTFRGRCIAVVKVNGQTEIAAYGSSLRSNSIII